MKKMDKNQISELRNRLESKEKFLPLFNYFLTKSIQEQRNNEKDKKGSLNYSSFYEKFINTYSKRNTEIVFKYCESPIERIFVNSLTLLFLRNQNTELHITEPFKNAELEIANYRKVHKNILSLADQYREMTGDETMENFETFFNRKIELGLYSKEDYNEFEYHRIVVDNFIWNSYHLTLQAGFPDYKINGKSTRVDILIWCPGDENIKLIVECDGFKYHNSKDAFEKDRKRDRLFKSKGYQVIRFSGTEIYRDPIGVSEIGRASCRERV